MKKSLVALLLLASFPAEGRTVVIPLTWASPAPVVEACLPATCGVAPIADLYKPLLIPRILAGGFNGGGGGASTAVDTNTPPSGTYTITGALNASSPEAGSNIIAQTKVADAGTMLTLKGGTTGSIQRMAFLWGSGSSQMTGHEAFTVQSDTGPKLILNSTTNLATLQGAVTDGGTAVANVIDNSVALANAAAKILSVRNNGTDEVGVRATSGMYFVNTTAPAGTDVGIGNDGGDSVQVNAKSTKRVILSINGISAAKMEAVAANPTNVDGQAEFSHISGGSGAPTSPTAGTGCGTSSAANNAGSDLAGNIGVTCGTAGTTTNPFVTITFAHAYNTAPRCTISPANAATAAGIVTADEFPTTTTTTLAITCGGGTCATGTLLWTYVCAQ